MNNIWIACDWHLWSDKKNIHHPYRSISNIGRLADQYTQDIDDTDIFIHLGDLSDISSTNQEKLESIIKSIPGYKILCKGNHDTESDEFYKMIGFDEVCEICIIHHVVFSHKPVKVPLDMINVHGHLHTEKMSTLGYQHINAFDSNYSTHPILLEDLLEKAPYQKPEEWATTDLKHVDEKFEKYTSLVSGDQYTKIIDLTDRVKLYPMDENVETVTFKTPEELSRWMRSNIHYANFSHLKSSNEVLTSKSGSCHDQVVFEYNELKKIGKKPKILFFIAYKEGSNQGGMTHSLVYYNENNKIKWFENSWSGLEGIHTYDSLSELKDDIKKYYSNMPDAKNFPELEFKSVRISDFKTGMSLGNFVSGIMDEAAIQWKDDKGNDIPKVCPKCGSKVGVFLRGEPVFLCTNKECEKYFGTVPFPENESIDYDLIDAGDSIMTEIIFDDLEDVKYFEADDTSRSHPKKEKTRLSTDNDEPIAESMLTYPGEKILGFAEEKGLGSRKYHLVNTDQNSIVESTNRKSSEKVDTINVNDEKLDVYRKTSENPNDPVGKEAHDLAFYLDNTKIADISISAVNSNKAFLYNFEVKKSYRGKGYGSAILKYVLSHYKVNELTVDKSNTRAIKLYKRFGFKTGIEFKEDGKTRVDMKINLNESSLKSDKMIALYLNEASSISSKFYFISQHGDWNESVIHPRVPSNFMTKNGYEENKTPRVCFSTSIDSCLRALSQNVNGKEFYVYNPEISSKHTVYKPTQKEVPDAKVTNEHWILQPVTLHCIGKIRVTGEKGNGIPYKYGDKNQYTAELYDWKWKWIEKYDRDKTINEMAYEDYADHYLKVLRKAADDLNHDEKVWKHLAKVCNVEIDHLPKFTCKLKFSGEPQLCYEMIEDREQVPFEIRCNMEAYLSELCKKLEKDRTERKEYPGVTSMFSVDGDGLIYINLARNLESINEMYLSSLSAYEEDAAQLHTYSKEDKEEVYKKYGIRPVGEYRETDHEKENKDTVESRREKLQEQRKKDLAKARKVKKRKAFVRKVKSHLPGLKNEDTAVDTSDADQYDEPDVESDRLWGDQIRVFKNKWNDQYPVGLVNSVNESYQFEMLDKVYFHDSINESSEDTKLYPVYVMLMHSGTALANAIKTITKSNFSHASISFDSSMKSMYSFGRKSDTNPFIGAFKKEDITTKFFQNKEIPYALYVVPCTKSEIDAMKKRLNFFIQNSTKFKYDFTGLFKNYFGIADNPEYKWFCSRFVADILNAGRPQNDPYVIEPSLMKPEDFTNTNFATYVTGGMLDTYDKSYVDKRTSYILRLERLRRVKEKALNTQNETAIINLDPFDPLQEAVLEYQLTAMNDSDLDNFIDYLTKFKVRYSKDGNLIITRYDYDQLDRYYRRDLKIMDQAQKDGTVSTVKEKLAELHYIYLILSKYYLTPDLQNNPNTSKDVKQAMFDLRSDLLTKTSQYAKWVSIQDPQFNLMEYYQASKYAKHQIPTKLLTMIDKEIITELQ